jgi:GNAT superfamily N-acetyltransferase
MEDVLAICRAFDRAYTGESEFTLEDIREEWATLDLERNTWIVELDGTAAGYMQLEDRGGGRLMSDGYVDPKHVGKGIGGLLVDLAERRAAELLGSQPEGVPVELHTGVLAADPAVAPLLTGRGYNRIRVFLRMVLDMEGRPRIDDAPGGIHVEPIDLEQAPKVHAAIVEAMADHWSYSPPPLQEWLLRTQRERFDPAHWLVAWEGNEVAGALLGEWKRNDAGWIDTVAVRRPWRGRGIAGHMLRRSFAEFYDRGERRCALGVDAASPTGATRVYERVGMRTLWQADVYAKRLRG